MCGRYSLTVDIEDVQKRFAYVHENLNPVRRYNIAPTESVVTVVRATSGDDKQNYGEIMRWGFIPSWSKGVNRAPHINARDDKLETSRMFSEAYERRRCLIPADGFFEWRTDAGNKIPYRFTLKGGGLFGFAGIWESWRSPEGKQVRSCAIITTEPNELVAPIHDRMPVILAEEAESAWLDPARMEFHTLRAFLKPFPAGSMDCYAVSNRVNYVKNDDPSCTSPVGEVEPLFQPPTLT